MKNLLKRLKDTLIEKWIWIVHLNLLNKITGKITSLPDSRYSTEYYLFLPEKYDKDNKKVAYCGKVTKVPPYLTNVIDKDFNNPSIDMAEYVIIFDNWK